MTKKNSKRAKITQAKEGKWYLLMEGGFIQTCCGCGMEHQVDWMIHKGRLALKWFKKPTNS